MVALLKEFAWVAWLEMTWLLGGPPLLAAVLCGALALLGMERTLLRWWLARRAYRAAVKRRLAWGMTTA